MFSVLLGGKLTKPPKKGMGKNGKPYCLVSLRASVHATEADDADSVFVSGVAFGTDAETLARLDQGDSISITGNAKLQSWEKEGRPYTGINVQISGVLTPYMVKKRRGDAGYTQKRIPERGGYEQEGAQRFYGNRDRANSRHEPTPDDFNDELSF